MGILPIDIDSVLELFYNAPFNFISGFSTGIQRGVFYSIFCGSFS